MTAVSRLAGGSTLVASVVPPRPVSSTAQSTRQSAKYLGEGGGQRRGC